MKRLFILCEYIKVLSGGLRRIVGLNPKVVREAAARGLKKAGKNNLNSDEKLIRAMRTHLAVEMLADCKGGTAEWRDVVDALNMIEALMKIDPRKFKYFGVFKAASAAITAAIIRHQETRSNVLRPCEVDALRGLSAAWSSALKDVHFREYFHAEEAAIRKAQNALSRGSHGNVRVLEVA
jgi:hypothetical protein